MASKRAKVSLHAERRDKADIPVSRFFGFWAKVMSQRNPFHLFLIISSVIMISVVTLHIYIYIRMCLYTFYCGILKISYQHNYHNWI